MSTTNLFVELIVIGVGASLWAALLILSLFGINFPLIGALVTAPVAAIPALAIVYLLGIITDRIADIFAHRIHTKDEILKRFSSMDEYFVARLNCLSKDNPISKQFEYNRSRQRICRGWMLNSVLSVITMGIFHVSRGAALGVTLGQVICSMALLVGLAAGCHVSWKKLVDTEISRLRDHLATAPAGNAQT